MFGSDKNQSFPSRRASSSSGKDGGVTILTAGCHFSGKLYCKGATRIGGTIDGEIIAEGLLIVEEDAVINAQVKAEEVVVHGRVEGNLTVQKKIEMCATADVQADITTPNLVVQEGALYNGRTNMKRAAASGEAGTRDGKIVRDLNANQPNVAALVSDNDQSNNIAARVPDISFA
jgi:cytoskeletal protein CcmA (bactofilin family)